MEVIKVGDRVEVNIPDQDIYFKGEVTIIKFSEAKVLPDGDYDYNYDYYPIECIIKINDLE